MRNVAPFISTPITTSVPHFSIDAIAALHCTYNPTKTWLIASWFAIVAGAAAIAAHFMVVRTPSRFGMRKGHGLTKMPSSLNSIPQIGVSVAPV